MKKTLCRIFLNFMYLIIMIVCTGTIMSIFNECIYCFEKWTFVTISVFIVTFLCFLCLYKTSIKFKFGLKKIFKIITRNIEPKMYKKFFNLSIFLSFVGILIVINETMKTITVIKDVTIINLLMSSSIILIIGTIIFYLFLCIFAYALNISSQLCKIIKNKIKY